MPELKDVIESSTVVDTDTTTTNVVDVTTIDSTGPTDSQIDLPNDSQKVNTPATAKKAPVKKVAAKPAVAKKTSAKKTTTTEKPTNEISAATANSVPTTTATTSKKKAVTEADADTEKNESNLRRPPMEQLTKDFERYVLSLTIADQPIKKLEYKCGKVIFGLSNESSKDFRVIAYKARKKSKTVAGKSRCIFFFGIHNDVSNIVKQFPGTTTTEFGQCSVQCKKPIQLVLDKQTFADNFNQDIEKVIATLKQLAVITIEQKNEQWKLLQEKLAAKKAAAKTTTETTENPAGSE
jgi:hypothetical protein